jgi:hypothetical protein
MHTRVTQFGSEIVICDLGSESDGVICGCSSMFCAGITNLRISIIEAIVTRIRIGRGDQRGRRNRRKSHRLLQLAKIGLAGRQG